MLKFIFVEKWIPPGLPHGSSYWKRIACFSNMAEALRAVKHLEELNPSGHYSTFSMDGDVFVSADEFLASPIPSMEGKELVS